MDRHDSDGTPHMIVLRFPTPTHFRVRALEWGLAAVLITCALILAQPAATFDNPAFHQLARITLPGIGAETLWTWACLVIGVARLLALYVNGAWVPSPWVRLACSLLSALFWTQLVLGLVGVPTVPLGLGIFPWFVVADLYSAMRAGQDARLTKEALKAKPEAPVAPAITQ